MSVVGRGGGLHLRWVVTSSAAAWPGEARGVAAIGLALGGGAR